MSKIPYRAVLFDLDGTLTDPLEGIQRSLVYAHERVARPMPDVATLHEWIGPPLRDSFMRHLADASLAEIALEAYRERYGVIGMLENEVYAGIPELLAALKAAGVRLFVATSKIRPPTEGILAHFGLAQYFEAVGAPEPHDSADKAEVIASLREVIGADWGSAVMVGDTPFDVLGARANSLPCIAVSYGYGRIEALRSAEPHAIAESVGDLARMLL
jgi:phosphoglycolate phosphatase